MNNSRPFFFGLFFLLLLGCSCAHAEIQLHGFADIIGSKTDNDLTLANIGNRGKQLNFDTESRVGINLAADFSEDISFAGQLLGRGVGNGSYNFSADWLFITWKPENFLSVRVGRQIYPAFLFSEQVDVGYTYLWVRLPQEVYGQLPLKSFNGVTLSASHAWDNIQTSVDVYYGSNSVNATLLNGTTITGSDSNVAGAQWTLSSDAWKVRAGYKSSLPKLDPLSPFLPPFDIGIARLLSAGGTGEFNHFVLTGELDRSENSGPTIHASNGAYGSVGYRLTPKLTPYFMYSWEGAFDGTYFVMPGGIPGFGPMEQDQHSIMLGLNYKANPSTVLKVEYQRSQFNSASYYLKANTITASLDVIF